MPMVIAMRVVMTRHSTVVFTECDQFRDDLNYKAPVSKHQVEDVLAP
jgi:hypothetical protein